jgi:hypothetical protein
MKVVDALYTEESNWWLNSQLSLSVCHGSCRWIPWHLLTERDLKCHGCADRVADKEIALAETVLFLQDTDGRENIVDVVGVLGVP